MKHAKRLMLMLAMLVITAGPAVAKDYELHQAVLDDNIGRVDKLLSKGLFIDEIGSRKYGYGSALHLAVREGHLKIAKLLLDRGAQVDVLDPDDFTPLHNAAWNGNLEMTKLLLEAGADINASTYDGDTPLSLAQNNDKTKVAKFIQAKLQTPPVNRAKAASTPTNESGVIDISGTYISESTGSGPSSGATNFLKKLNGKLIVLKQTGNTITGSVGPHYQIEGTREGNIINYYILKSNEIIGSWEINADATNLEGKWFTTGGGTASGKWNLTRVESQTASDPGVIDISGTYISEATGSGPAMAKSKLLTRYNGKLIVLKQTGNTITGSVGPHYQVEGTREGNIINFYILKSDGIIGSWEINADATIFEGKWSTNDAGGATGKWNLTRVE